MDTGRDRRGLRRYAGDSNCAGPLSYHNASVPLDETEHSREEGSWPRDDPRWPTHCLCGYAFQPADEWQLFQESLFRREDTGELMTLREAPPGAIWDAVWWPEKHRVDGQYLVCKLPGGHDWMIDGRANNCDSPCLNCNQPYHAHYGLASSACQHYVDSRPHHCWVRHGTAPNLTVDKAGLTCGAGAGSIQVPGWHGFLRQGQLVT